MKRLALTGSSGYLPPCAIGTAYGACPDNPVPIEESWGLRPAKFQYTADKVAIEGLGEIIRSRQSRAQDA